MAAGCLGEAALCPQNSVGVPTNLLRRGEISAVRRSSSRRCSRHGQGVLERIRRDARPNRSRFNWDQSNFAETGHWSWWSAMMTKPGSLRLPVSVPLRLSVTFPVTCHGHRARHDRHGLPRPWAATACTRRPGVGTAPVAGGASSSPNAPGRGVRPGRFAPAARSPSSRAGRPTPTCTATPSCSTSPTARAASWRWTLGRCMRSRPPRRRSTRASWPPSSSGSATGSPGGRPGRGGRGSWRASTTRWSSCSPAATGRSSSRQRSFRLRGAGRRRCGARPARRRWPRPQD